MPDDFGNMIAAVQGRMVPVPTVSEHSDDALALAFTARHGRELLYVAEWGQWLAWDGKRWACDKTLAVFDKARAICRKAAEKPEQTQSGGRSQIASAQKVAAVERLAKSDRQHARAADDFDARPWELNTPGGVVDLMSGRMRPHQPGDLFTKVTAVAPCGSCPRWLAFLGEILQGDEAAVAYIQRWAGYMLTGSTREHAFLFLQGPGGNGKSVLVNTLAAMVGDYAAAADMELFMVSKGNSHPTGLADLRGARLVLAQETEAGRVLAEAKLKSLTGGDRIKARFMRQDFFEYQPVFKLVMVGNHRPVIRNPDDAMRRRLHLLPVSFKPARPDRDLTETLKAEMPGILAWAIEGCMVWQREGLGMPATVREATDAYFAEQDLVPQWLAERCLAGRQYDALSSALFRDWKAWAEARGEHAGSGKAFSANLERYHAKQTTRDGVKFRGLRLRLSDTGAILCPVSSS